MTITARATKSASGLVIASMKMHTPSSVIRALARRLRWATTRHAVGIFALVRHIPPSLSGRPGSAPARPDLAASGWFADARQPLSMATVRWGVNNGRYPVMPQIFFHGLAVSMDPGVEGDLIGDGIGGAGVLCLDRTAPQGCDLAFEGCYSIFEAVDGGHNFYNFLKVFENLVPR